MDTVVGTIDSAITGYRNTGRVEEAVEEYAYFSIRCDLVDAAFLCVARGRDCSIDITIPVQCNLTHKTEVVDGDRYLSNGSCGTNLTDEWTSTCVGGVIKITSAVKSGSCHGRYWLPCADNPLRGHLMDKKISIGRHKQVAIGIPG